MLLASCSWAGWTVVSCCIAVYISGLLGPNAKRKHRRLRSWRGTYPLPVRLAAVVWGHTPESRSCPNASGEKLGLWFRCGFGLFSGRLMGRH